MSQLLSLEKLKTELPKSLQILAVSKLQPVEKIKKLVGEGQVDFGENYVQEFKEKHEALSNLNLRWHLIGHLQKNKVKLIVGKCFLIHSVDSFELAVEIDKRAAAAGVYQKILLQVNVAGENSKEGFDPKILREQIAKIFLFKNIEVVGLMTMPPFVENPEHNRQHFRKLKELFIKIKSGNQHLEGFTELSMGTSQDYKVAAEEGATWIRLGSTLFGARS